jgi:hypothetical protein
VRCDDSTAPLSHGAGSATIANATARLDPCSTRV